MRRLVEEPHDILELHVAAAEHRRHDNSRTRRTQSTRKQMLGDTNKLWVGPLVWQELGSSQPRRVLLAQAARVIATDEVFQQLLQIADSRRTVRQIRLCRLLRIRISEKP